MKTLSVSVFVAAMLVGQLYNGHGTETLGVYLLAFVGAWLVVSCLAVGAWTGMVEISRRRHRRGKSCEAGTSHRRLPPTKAPIELVTTPPIPGSSDATAGRRPRRVS